MPGHYGPATAGVTLTETEFASAWNVQGHAQRRDFVDHASRLLDVALPVAPNTTARYGALTAMWLGPASWLVVAAGATPAPGFAAARETLNAAGGALFDVTASRVAWTIAGPDAATVLAKGCPLDFAPRAFRVDACAQSLFGHVQALFYRRATSPAFTMMVPRSFARDAWRMLCLAAAPHGYDVLPTRFF